MSETVVYFNIVHSDDDDDEPEGSSVPKSYVALEDPINHENTMESRELTRFQNQDEPNNEPSNEHNTICSKQCCELDPINQSPYQITNQQTLSQTKKLQGRRYRQFCVEWYTAYPWLYLCLTSLEAFCHLCKFFHQGGNLLDKNLDDAFITTGFNNWKKARERFTKHEKSNSHRKSLFKIQQMKGSHGIGTQLDEQMKKNQQLHCSMLLKQLSSLRYLAPQGLAVRGHEQIEGNLIQLLLLHSEDCPELKQWVKEKHYLSSEILNEMLSLMARAVTIKLLENIREASIYSLIADEARDITNKEQLCISIRWVTHCLIFMKILLN